MERLSSISSLKYRAGRSIHSTVQDGKCYTECFSVALSKEGSMQCMTRDPTVVEQFESRIHLTTGLTNTHVNNKENVNVGI